MILTVMNSEIKSKLENCYTIYKCYENILNSYVSDYYVEKHWNKLPLNWQENLDDISMDQLYELLDLTKQIEKKIYSLSLLCLRILIINNMIPRKKMSIPHPVVNKDDIFQNKNFNKHFWKNVKLKKRHEIDIVADLCYSVAVKTNCFYIVDIGSGLGHLSRKLSYSYGFKVCTFEADNALNNLAKEMDNNFEVVLKSKALNHRNCFKTVHINKRIETDLKSDNFSQLVKEAFNHLSGDFKFGIVGLHPCGNLGSTLLRLYKECPEAVFINIISCCYMKLLLEPSLNTGFPLSSFCKNNNVKLSYLSCEVACHAIENYAEKFKESQNFQKFKIHAYRAGLEKILISLNPTLKHSAVCSVKYGNNLSFKDYCEKTLQKLNLQASNDIISSYEKLIDNTWKKVVTFYSLRLLLAPLVETIILFDRLLFIKECKSYCEILPIFDCKISPRNHVLSAIKRDSE